MFLLYLLCSYCLHWHASAMLEGWTPFYQGLLSLSLVVPYTTRNKRSCIDPSLHMLSQNRNKCHCLLSCGHTCYLPLANCPVHFHFWLSHMHSFLPPPSSPHPTTHSALDFPTLTWLLLITYQGNSPPSCWPPPHPPLLLVPTPPSCPAGPHPTPSLARPHPTLLSCWPPPHPTPPSCWPPPHPPVLLAPTPPSCPVGPHPTPISCWPPPHPPLLLVPPPSPAGPHRTLLSCRPPPHPHLLLAPTPSPSPAGPHPTLPSCWPPPHPPCHASFLSGCDCSLRWGYLILLSKIFKRWIFSFKSKLNPPPLFFPLLLTDLLLFFFSFCWPITSNASVCSVCACVCMCGGGSCMCLCACVCMHACACVCVW